MSEGAGAFATISTGARLECERVVDESLLTCQFPGRSVLSTPSMIMLMELASHAAVADELSPGYTTVGYEVHVRHVTPAPAGGPSLSRARWRRWKGTSSYSRSPAARARS